ncbi:hypothetical protein CSKR_201988 [Clonorchis sinensis]|uniref:Uncharacterized protein n=1 Tax=Clonorchis sinensis TaxID=79923 RepID=A0A8T1MYC2_CLOSI|nr:hypothetical protein CSKR_201988 [Clonorchis sinensis]
MNSSTRAMDSLVKWLFFVKPFLSKFLQPARKRKKTLRVAQLFYPTMRSEIQSAQNELSETLNLVKTRSPANGSQLINLELAVDAYTLSEPVYFLMVSRQLSPHWANTMLIRRLNKTLHAPKELRLPVPDYRPPHSDSQPSLRGLGLNSLPSQFDAHKL